MTNAKLLEDLMFSNLVKGLEVDDAKRRHCLTNVAPAERSYVIFFSARSGSSWLTSVLSATKRLGFPEEYINPNFVAKTAKAMNAKDPEDLLRMLQRMKKTPNGIFGMEAREVDFQLLGVDALVNVLAENSVFFHLWRDNLVAQAISLQRAVASERYHSTNPSAKQAPAYDADGILHWLRHVAATENGNVRLLQQLGLAARHLRYEDITVDRVATVRTFAHVMGVPFTPDDFREEPSGELRKIGDEWNLSAEAQVRREHASDVAKIEESRLIKLGVVGSDPHAMPADPELQDAWRAGRERGALGRSPLTNPHQSAPLPYRAWLTGWKAGWNSQRYIAPARPSVPATQIEPTSAVTTTSSPAIPITDVKIDPSTELHISPGRFSPASNVLVLGHGNTVNIAAGAVGTFRIKIEANNSQLLIGEKVKVGGTLITFLGRGPCRLTIGNATTFTGNARLLLHEASELHLGADCMIAAGVDMITSDSHPIYDSTGTRINAAQSIVIGDHVWVCEGARIMKGASIGQGSVVALSAVVMSGVYPPNALLAGAPAKIVRQDIRWERKLPD